MISLQDASRVDFPDYGCPVRPARLPTRQCLSRDVGLIAFLNVPDVVERVRPASLHAPDCWARGIARLGHEGDFWRRRRPQAELRMCLDHPGKHCLWSDCVQDGATRRRDLTSGQGISARERVFSGSRRVLVVIKYLRLLWSESTRVVDGACSR
jgi:hypothetical protein